MATSLASALGFPFVDPQLGKRVPSKGNTASTFPGGEPKFKKKPRRTRVSAPGTGAALILVGDITVAAMHETVVEWLKDQLQITTAEAERRWQMAQEMGSAIDGDPFARLPSTVPGPQLSPIDRESVEQRRLEAAALESEARQERMQEAKSKQREADRAGGICDCPGDLCSDGSICGGRCANYKAGGREPACSSDPVMVTDYLGGEARTRGRQLMKLTGGELPRGVSLR